MMSAAPAFIPAPPFDSLGPFRLYGLMIALGVLASVALARRRWAARGNDPEQISAIALWAVPAGLIGSRIYHVITDYDRLYCGQPRCERSLIPGAFEIWNGGLGIPGGIIAGVAVGIFVGYRMGVDWRDCVDAAIPGLPLAQAIGRLGNYFNQELFGRPTTVPWALKVEPKGGMPLDGYVPGFETYHPTFAYELIWNLGVVGVLLWIDSKRRLGKGKLLGAYVALYFLGRLWIEAMRSDTATEVFGIRVNIWTSIVGITIGVVIVLWKGPLRSHAATAEALAVEPFLPVEAGSVEDGDDPHAADAAAEETESAASDAGSIDPDEVEPADPVAEPEEHAEAGDQAGALDDSESPKT
ncbi:MAG: prolipoprotein diacylglyceryl transferase [Candidatus Microthrix parvicella]